MSKHEKPQPRKLRVRAKVDRLDRGHDRKAGEEFELSPQGIVCDQSEAQYKGEDLWYDIIDDNLPPGFARTVENRRRRAE